MLLSTIKYINFYRKRYITMTLCHVLMTNKPFLSYQKILKDIKLLVENYNISWDMNKVKFVRYI